MNADRQDLEWPVGLVAGIVAVGFAGLLLGPSAAILLATIIVVLATVLSGRTDLVERDESELQAAINEDFVAVLDESPWHPLLTEDRENVAAIHAVSIENVAPAVERPEAVHTRYNGFRSVASELLRGELLRTNSLTMLVSGLVAGILGFMLFADLGDIPAGLFCDEAEIGIRSRELLTKQLTSLEFPFFYRHFSYSHMGALPLYASVPFVAILGLSDFSIRLASLAWSIGAIVLLIALVRRLKWSYGEIGILAFAFSPVFLHLSRVNFAHSPSLFCIAAALYCYARTEDGPQWRWPVMAGIAFGLSVYGNSAYYLATPVVLLGLVLGEIITRRANWRGYRTMGLTLVATAIVWIPVAIKAFTDDRFMKRFNEKQFSDAPLFSWDRLNTVADNYLKYFSSKYFFTEGESALPGGFISRHSVLGAGELPWIALPLVMAGIVAIFRVKEPLSRLFGIIGLTTMVLYPLPDVLTTSVSNPPYTFAVYSTMIFVPLLAALGMHWLMEVVRAKGGFLFHPRVLSMILLAVIVVGGIRFYIGPYQDYPNVSAGYYGWQYGPRQATDAFRKYDATYDRFLLDGDFNEAFVFLDFYLADDKDLRAKSVIGGLDQATLSRHELFAVRRDRYDALMLSEDRIRLYTRVIDVIRYPAGDIVLYLVDVSPQNYRGFQEVPR